MLRFARTENTLVFAQEHLACLSDSDNHCMTAAVQKQHMLQRPHMQQSLPAPTAASAGAGVERPGLFWSSCSPLGLYASICKYGDQCRGCPVPKFVELLCPEYPLNGGCCPYDPDPVYWPPYPGEAPYPYGSSCFSSSGGERHMKLMAAEVQAFARVDPIASARRFIDIIPALTSLVELLQPSCR